MIVTMTKCDIDSVPLSLLLPNLIFHLCILKCMLVNVGHIMQSANLTFFSVEILSGGDSDGCAIDTQDGPHIVQKVRRL